MTIKNRALRAIASLTAALLLAMAQLLILVILLPLLFFSLISDFGSKDLSPAMGIPVILLAYTSVILGAAILIGGTFKLYKRWSPQTSRANPSGKIRAAKK